MEPRRRSFPVRLSHPSLPVEPLESRALLSVATEPAVPAPAATTTPTTTAPVARLVSRSVVTRGSGHSFHVVVSSAAGLAASAVGDDDVLVSGPRGFAAAAQVTNVVASEDGTRLLVACHVRAPGGSFDRRDNGVYRVALRAGGVSDLAGAAAPSRVIGSFLVVARAPARPTQAPLPVLPLGPAASAGALSAELTRVYAWCDHMPGVIPEPDNREYLVLATTLRNNSDQPLEVRLDKAYLSFAEDELGQPSDGVSVKRPDGPPSGVKSIVLQPGDALTVQFRGDGVYPEDRHGQRLYVTLQFSAGGETLAVRNSAVVVMTW